MQFPFLKKTEPHKNFFLSLLVKPRSVAAILFEEINSKLVILSSEEIESQDTASVPLEELLASCDKVVTLVEQSLPTSAEVDKTIFSLPYDWIEEGKIKKEHLAKLKRVCDELALIPLGFLSSIEAIVHYLQKTEGAPPSSIFVEVAQDQIFLYLVRAGKIIEAHTSSIEDNLIKTVEKLLAGVERLDVLPPKIILLAYKGADDIQQEFLSHKWPKNIPFLHIPQVVTLEKGFENEAVINGVATQMELEVLENQKSESQIEKSKDSQGALVEASPDEFGFLKDKDIREEAAEEAEKEIETVHQADSELDLPKDGFQEEGGGFAQKIPRFSLKPYLAALQIPKLPSFNLNLPFVPKGIKTSLILGLVGVIILAVIFSFLYYNFILIADITVLVDKKAIEKSVTAQFAENGDPDTSVQLKLTRETIEGKETADSTGKKETGEKAKGTVTIYSSLPREQTFSKGTTIASVTTKRDFTLNENAKVASSSGVTDIKTVKIQVTASEIGKEFNLPSGTKFTIATFDSSEVEAKNDSAFLGGTKKEITVVSDEDLEKLLSTTIDNLEDKAISNQKGKIDNESLVFPKSLSTNILDKKYTRKAGEEANTVGLSTKIEYTIGIYTKRDLQKIIERAGAKDIPQGYGFQAQDSKVDIKDIKVKGTGAEAKLLIEATFTPSIDAERLAHALRGKSTNQTATEISSIAGVSNVNIILRRKVPFMPEILPQNSKNIRIEVKT